LARLLFGGYFGCGNLGDDSILLGTVRGLESFGHDFTVLSGAPEETYRNYGLASVPRRENAAIMRAIERCDALVFPGGSIFQDSTSIGSVFYYAQLVQAAKRAGKKVVLVGQGIGPLTKFLGRRWAAMALEAADVLVVRDPASANALAKLGVSRKVRIGADPAFLLPEISIENLGQGYTVGDMRTVGLAPRPLGKKTKMIAELFGGVARTLFQANVMPVLIEMDRKEDGPLIDAINKQQGGKVPDLRKVQTPMQMQQRMARMDGVIAMRLHAGVLATTVGVPPYMVDYDPKVAAFAKILDLSVAPSIDGLTSQRLVESFMAFHKDREKHQKALVNKRAEMLKLAQVNIEAILEAIR
jgi:polysaccharide pyruvyl transferase CsaB